MFLNLAWIAPVRELRYPLPLMLSMDIELVAVVAYTFPVTEGMSIFPESDVTESESQLIAEVLICPEAVVNETWERSSAGLTLMEPLAVVMESRPDHVEGRQTSTY